MNPGTAGGGEEHRRRVAQLVSAAGVASHEEISCKLHALFRQALQHASEGSREPDANTLIDKEILQLERLAQALRDPCYLKARRSFTSCDRYTPQDHSAWNREVPGLLSAVIRPGSRTGVSVGAGRDAGASE